MMGRQTESLFADERDPFSTLSTHSRETSTRPRA